MFSKFLEFIQKEALFKPSQKILLAVSGGVDSIVMAHLFTQANFQFGIIHCHFGLREEADQEAIFVETLAKKLQIPFFFRKFDTLTYAEKKKVSIQMAARELRYNFFEETRAQEQYDYIATAHHLHDSLETLLYNLAKGTGIAGLRGILAKKGHIIRPLLFSNRLEITKYAQKNSIEWMEDASNASDKYSRNFIRHQIVPLLEKLNPDLIGTFSETLLRLQSVEKVYQKETERLKETYIQKIGDCVYLEIGKEEISTPLLHELLNEYGFSFRQCEQIAVSKQTGADFYAEKYWAVLDRGKLVISPLSYQNAIKEIFNLENNEEIQTPYFKAKTQIVEKEKIVFEKNNNCIYLDYNKLEFPLKIRVWQQGDFFKPLGMQGKQKISDFLINQKVPKNLKNRIFVLISGEKITCIAGYRSSEEFKITNHTQKALKVEFEFKI